MAPHHEQVQGHAALHQKDGWTAICFWDRSEDKRGGCNSNFFAHGIFTFDEMVQISKEIFPTVWARFNFPVILVQNNGEGVPEVMSMVEKAADYARVVAELEATRRKLDLPCKYCDTCDSWREQAVPPPAGFDPAIFLDAALGPPKLAKQPPKRICSRFSFEPPSAFHFCAEWTIAVRLKPEAKP
jgi:hypothetical protein